MNQKQTNPGANVPKQQPDEPRGDRGADKTWQPPAGEQGISNRPDDEDASEEDDSSKD
jgi:hypothetical protein